MEREFKRSDKYTEKRKIRTRIPEIPWDRTHINNTEKSKREFQRSDINPGIGNIKSPGLAYGRNVMYSTACQLVENNFISIDVFQLVAIKKCNEKNRRQIL